MRLSHSLAMKLLVHNMLSSKFLKGVKVGFPLKIVALEVKVGEQEFNADFIRNMLPRLEWTALRQAAEQLGHASELPQQLPEEPDETVLKAVHHALLEVDVLEGHLECPETGRKFTIKEGIPNMLANEDEVE